MKNRLLALGWRLDKVTGNWIIPKSDVLNQPAAIPETKKEEA